MGLDRFDDDFRYGIANVLDIPGFNCKAHRYAEALTKLPQDFLLGSETASTKPVFACTSYPSAELFVNGQSQGG